MFESFSNMETGRSKLSVTDAPSSTTSSSGLNKEEVRLNTFRNWPRQSPVSIERLARAGFYYSSSGTEVTCFSCGGKISEWNFGDSVIEKHKRFYPNCQFVQNGANNVPYYPSLNADTSPNDVRTEVSNSPATRILQNGLSRPNCNGVQDGRSFGSDCPSPRTDLGGMNVQIPLNINVSCRNTTVCPNYRFEAERLKSFQGKWPLSFIDVIDLVKAGFYYTQVNDKVKCAFCDGVLTSWEPGDFPMTEHNRNFPLCPFVLGREVGNVPLPNVWDIPATSSRGPSSSKGSDVCGRYNWEVTYSVAENQGKLMKESKQDDVFKNLGIERHEGPQHPSQASKDARLRSFQSWPLSGTITPEQLAEAGFFYIGISDHTKCFYCDGGLCNWEPGDDPWVEHAKWFCNCTFVRLNKGESFIKACLESNSTLDNNSSGEINNHQPSAVPPVVSAIHQKVDELMSTNMVQAFIKTDVFPVYLVRQAILSLVQETGEGPKDFNDLSEAIDTVKMQVAATMSSKVTLTSQAANLNTNPNSAVQVQSVEEEEDVKMACNVQETKEIAGSVPSVPFLPLTELRKPNGGSLCSSLEEENRFLKEQRMCKICMDQEVGVVFLPCGHLIACPQCAPALKDCALCRTPIKGTIRTFLS